ncbi:universal stress protein [Methanomicrobium antiquum]|uniref:Universal stress protein n=1 Tax=Methanomicrobium antiquum TaxID=487686 RepID=A0AAF0JM07_9EURY|nr:universal stress protein [Methanomicrobium antiquum]MDD3976684.1 universal stress protein [Methanomicrobium sp.]WFN37299.1 universal stress protein [Methanomicrobium antiquum]
MKMLVLMDGTKWSQKAAMHALMLAKEKGEDLTEVVLFSVLDRNEVRSSAFYLCKQSNMCDRIAEHEAKIARDMRKNIGDDVADMILHLNRAGINCSSKIVEGKRAEEILKEINSDNYSLIVMGAFGKKSNVLVGTLYSEIAKDVDVPILIVN